MTSQRPSDVGSTDSIVELPDGREVRVFRFGNAAGIRVCVLEYGGILAEIWTPDRAGRCADIVLGFDSLAGYLDNPAYFGAVVGRYANRIAGAAFELDGIIHRLSANDGLNTLHGGRQGFDQALWRGTSFERGGESGVVLRLTSPDGDQGFPGRLYAEVVYQLDEGSQLTVEYCATCEQPTIINLTQHSYFNLDGDPDEAGRAADGKEGGLDILDHVLELAADQYLPVNAELLPSGAAAAVERTPFDFRRAARIGDRLGLEHPQLSIARGFDHNFLLVPNAPAAARLRSPRSGRWLEVTTTEPGLQVYTGNYFDASATGKRGRRYGRHAGVALEPQHFPDSPHHPDFPSVILRPGEIWRSRSQYRFGAA